MGIKYVVALVAVALFGCETRVEETVKKSPSKGVLMDAFKDKCSGRVYMKTFDVSGFHCRGCDCNRVKFALQAVEKYSHVHRILFQKNIYHQSWLEYIEIVVCDERSTHKY